jgi:hypothetical protein
MIRTRMASAAAAVLLLAACSDPSTAPSAASSPSLAAAANANGNKLQCFSGTTDGGSYGGTCSVTKDGVATLNNMDGDPDGSYSGVYLQNSNLDGKRLSDVNQLGFSYTGVAGAGAPRISLPIDTDANGTTDFYAFIAALYCNDGAGNVDAINDATCTIYAGSESFANWAAMLAAHPDWRVGESLPFIIADEPGHWTVSNVRLGKGPAGGAKP